MDEIGDILRAEIPRLLRLAGRLCGDRREAEDLVQEALLRAVRRKPDLGEALHLHAWLSRILLNLWRDRLRARARRREAPPGSAVPDAADPRPGPPGILEGAELLEQVRRALADLPPLQRAAMLLSADEGLPPAEIARALRTTADRVKANLWQARQKLRKALAGFLAGEKG